MQFDAGCMYSHSEPTCSSATASGAWSPPDISLWYSITGCVTPWRMDSEAREAQVLKKPSHGPGKNTTIAPNPQRAPALLRAQSRLWPLEELQVEKRRMCERSRLSTGHEAGGSPAMQNTFPRAKRVLARCWLHTMGFNQHHSAKMRHGSH